MTTAKMTKSLVKQIMTSHAPGPLLPGGIVDFDTAELARVTGLDRYDDDDALNAMETRARINALRWGWVTNPNGTGPDGWLLLTRAGYREI